MLVKKAAERATFSSSTGFASPFLEQARVASEHLTSSPEWNVFMQRVQALVDAERNLLNGMGDALALPNLTSEQVLQGQRHMLAAKAKIDAWEQVIRLPKEIIGNSEKASQTEAA